ncbi:transglutaminase family protein [Celeribacter litoreus]|uniref:transglutaminase family protein n=1 Tax=Celeribacter litoreus TaxID=2876714 RepID=UPI001CCC92EE|nr:transglutaminase family protein [Celeribacter litoreus]MCA0042250.1 transglutaminase family protein [Celeribacter litoreus]
MLYDLGLTITYSYASPSDRARTILRLLPANVPGVQTVRQRLLEIMPLPEERRDGRDFFGNETSMVAWHSPISELSLKVTAQVERFEPAPLFDFSPPLEQLPQELAGLQSLDPEAPHHFRCASPRVSTFDEITAYAKECLTDGVTVLGAIEAVGRALHKDMKFDAEATDVDTPLQDAFEKRHGVCQDFAHIMISALRGIGIPAAYASGFLRTFAPPGQPRLEGADAMHAWVRAWAGNQMGWVEFDPTNDQFAGGDYITIGYGRDYGDVAPVRGAMRSSGEHTTTQAVDVIPHEDAVASD